MAKNILIFSDGTGQFGGLKPDQRLSNVYKMFRAMRPGPSSTIKPSEQVAYYDPGLGAGETGGQTFKRIRNALEAAVGTGIDENVIDCYEKVISYYEPGDRILLFGFSRGAYTVRSLANVMNLCGVPTRMPDGGPVPKFGPRLRKIAEDAGKFVYNHGAGHPRDHDTYEWQREEKGKRFRAKYGSAPTDEGADVQGNVQPNFIGVFDTVASLGSGKVSWTVRSLFVVLALAFLFGQYFGWSLLAMIPIALAMVLMSYWSISMFVDQWKYYSPDPSRPLRFSNWRDWINIWQNGHRAVWKWERLLLAARASKRIATEPATPLDDAHQAGLLLPEGRALSARFLLLVVLRRAQDDPAIDRHHFQLKRKPLAIAVEPSGSDAGPETLVALVGDMPGEEVRRIGFLRGCVVAACHDDFLSCLVARCTKRKGRTAKGRIHVQHG